MTKDIAIIEKEDYSIIESVVMQGDLSKLDPKQRVMYYKKVCDSVGLNPYTRPFDYITLNGKLTLYAKKDCTEQLRKVHGISINKLEDKLLDDLYIVKATATARDGRTDEATGAVTIGNLKGDAKANAIMKAETKAKRRVTLSISGLGWTDETEIETIPHAKKVEVNLETGEIIESYKNEPKKINYTIQQKIATNSDSQNAEEQFNRVGTVADTSNKMIEKQQWDELHSLIKQCTSKAQDAAWCQINQMGANWGEKFEVIPEVEFIKLRNACLGNIQKQKTLEANMKMSNIIQREEDETHLS